MEDSSIGSEGTRYEVMNPQKGYKLGGWGDLLYKEKSN
jgi:hypothetical protein